MNKLKECLELVCIVQDTGVLPNKVMRMQSVCNSQMSLQQTFLAMLTALSNTY